MNYEAEKVTDDEWTVEAVDHASEGEVYVTRFHGLRAEERAREYAAWKNMPAEAT